jgi:poly(3-hydroxyalkanoate) synthetase
MTTPNVPASLLTNIGMLHGINAANKMHNFSNCKEIPIALRDSLNSFTKIVNGVQYYNKHQYNRNLPKIPIIMECGVSQLLDYSNIKNGEANILFVPSLINRSYILDLAENHSMVRYVSQSPYNTYMINWQNPKEGQLNYGIYDYVQEVIAAIDFISKTSDKPIILVGHCMGGILATLANNVIDTKIAGLALISVPWNFDCQHYRSIRKNMYLMEQVKIQECLPAEMVQLLFYFMNPKAVHDKFMRFAKAANNNNDGIYNIAIEQWVNDGVAMTAAVAQECFIQWIEQNPFMNNSYQLNGKKIDLEINTPVFCVVSDSDNIVPMRSSLPVTKICNTVEVQQSTSGHISMIVGRKAPSELWNPFIKWVGKQL